MSALYGMGTICVTWDMSVKEFHPPGKFQRVLFLLVHIFVHLGQSKQDVTPSRNLGEGNMNAKRIT